MVQVIQRRPREPSFREKIGASIGEAFRSGAEKIAEGYESRRKAEEFKNKMDEESNAIFKKTGGKIDLRGVYDPELRKAIVTQKEKTQGIMDVQNQGLSYLDKLFGDNQNEKMTEHEPESEMNEPVGLEGASANIFGEEKPQQMKEKPQKEMEKKKLFSPKMMAAASIVNPNVGKVMQAANNEIIEKDKLAYERERDLTKEANKEKRAIHEESAKFDDKLEENTKVARDQFEHIKDIEKAVRSGKVKPFSVSNIFRKFGPIGELFAKAALNNDEATLMSSIPSLLAGWKEVFGVRLSDADLKILEEKLPDIGKNPEANLAITGIIKKYADRTILRSKIAQDIKEKNGGYRPMGYANQIEKRYEEMTKPVQVISPMSGKPIEIPAYQLSEALAFGAKLYEGEQEEEEAEQEGMQNFIGAP